MDITQVIKNQCKHYKTEYNLSPQQINNGQCSEFAEDLEDMGFGYATWGDELNMSHWSEKIWSMWSDWSGIHTDGHCFTMFNDRFYDSECPEGCEYPDQLPFYQRELKYIDMYC